MACPRALRRSRSRSPCGPPRAPRLAERLVDASVASSLASRLTTPSSTRTAKRVAQPTSGARASPSTSEIAQLCSGQATCSPNTMPWLSGPPLCGQRSSSANTRSSAVRNTATSAPAGAPHAARAQHGDVVDAADRGSSRCSILTCRSVVAQAGTSGMNWRSSTAALSNSNHGSGSPSSANCSRSHSALRFVRVVEHALLDASRPTRAIQCTVRSRYQPSSR